MFRSLRGRLLFWYTAMLALMIALSGTMACYLAWRARVNDIDRELLAYAESLAASIRHAGPTTFDLDLPPLAQTGGDASRPYHVIWAPDGVAIDRSDPDIVVPLPDLAGPRLRGGRREISLNGPSGVTVLAGRSLEAVWSDVRTLASRVALLGLAAVLASLGIGWWIVGRALAPIDRISGTARRMAGGDFAARIAVEQVETELGALAAVLNDAFDRLHGSLERQRRFTADASHELRTPLATLTTEAHWALSRERRDAEYRQSLETCRRAADRMRGVVERLLALARLEAGAEVNPPNMSPVRVDTLLQQVASDLRPLADARGIRLQLTTVEAEVRGDDDRLLDAFTNILANAIQYNVDAGEVHATVERSAGDVVVTVRDTGIGVAAGDLPRVFEPFFRADPSRRRDAGGAGLGLAVTRAIVEQHGGEITCTSVIGVGTTIRVSLRSVPGNVPVARTSGTSPPTFAESRR